MDEHQKESSRFKNPEEHPFIATTRACVAAKLGGIVPPPIMDVHFISGRCNLNCRWCVGRADRESIDPLPDILLDPAKMVGVLKKILDPRWYPLWPGEFHICGADSEPLQSPAVAPAIRFLLSRGRIIELITNGLLLDRVDIADLVPRIAKLHVSIDVTNESDSRKYKLKAGESHDIRYYDKVRDNIRAVISQSRRLKTKLYVQASFVATPKTFRQDAWTKCFISLAKDGVSRISVRDDFTKTFPIIVDLKSRVEEIALEVQKAYPQIKIEYITPDPGGAHFAYCMGPRLWPTLAVDGCLYACAHVATAKYIPFADLLSETSLLELYQKLFLPPGESSLKVEDIGCHRECPSLIGAMNDPNSFLAEKWQIFAKPIKDLF